MARLRSCLIRTEARLHELQRRAKARSSAIRHEGMGAVRLRIQLKNKADAYATRRTWITTVLASERALREEAGGGTPENHG